MPEPSKPKDKELEELDRQQDAEIAKLDTRPTSEKIEEQQKKK
jgi:hypothetical protein